MKYWKITRKPPYTNYLRYEKAESLESLKYDNAEYEYGNDLIFTEITKAEYDQHFIDEAIRNNADKGREVENAIEFNDSIKEYVLDLMRDQQFLIWGNEKDMVLNPTDPSHLKSWDTNMKLWKAYRGMYKSIVIYERKIAIATNIDPTHPVSMPSKEAMVNILSHIKANDPDLWLDITKMGGVEISYEPKAFIDIWEEIQKVVNSHAHPTTDTDPLNVGELVSGGTN